MLCTRRLVCRGLGEVCIGRELLTFCWWFLLFVLALLVLSGRHNSVCYWPQPEVCKSASCTLLRVLPSKPDELMRSATLELDFTSLAGIGT